MCINFIKSTIPFRQILHKGFAFAVFTFYHTPIPVSIIIDKSDNVVHLFQESSISCWSDSVFVNAGYLMWILVELTGI